MRIWFSLLIFAATVDISAQNINDPFIGGIEIGIGFGTVIDFNFNNNKYYIGNVSDAVEMLTYLPTHVGLVTAKYLNANKYFEFGALYSRKCSFYDYHYSNGTGSIRGGGALVFHCIDLPIKYYSYAGKIFKQQMYAYGGIVPSWIVEPTQYIGDFEIPEDCFRDFCLSVCGGLCFDKKKSRMKLHAGLAVTSVVDASYRDIPEEDREYGGRIYPFELLFCYARMFR
jgi:hypothetical protein